MATCEFTNCVIDATADSPFCAPHLRLVPGAIRRKLSVGDDTVRAAFVERAIASIAAKVRD